MINTVYEDFSKALVKTYEYFLTNITMIRAYQNGDMPTLPYITYHILDLDPIGDSNKSTGVIDELQSVTQFYEARVRIEVIGRTANFDAANIAGHLDSIYASSMFAEIASYNELGVASRSKIKSVPKKQDTEYFMAWQQDISFTFGYKSEMQTPAIEYVKIQDNWIPEKPQGLE